VPEYWPCNYFNRLDNACDVGHVPFTHREAVRRIGRGDRMAVREVHAEETEYGVRSWSAVPGRPNEYTHFHMPNTNQITANTRVEGSLEDARTLRGDRISWRVPVDDDNTVSFSVDLLYLEGAEAEAYRQRRRETEQIATNAPPPQMGDAILAGRVREEDLDARLSTATLFSVEDYVTQVGQAIADRTQDRLGKNDVGLALMRKLWERELRALEEGRPLTEWHTRPGLAAMSNPLAAEFAARAGRA
jgi:5,5'-dehydrodivanillate O-demethylase